MASLIDLLTLPRTQVMGIVNVTPDSFSDGGKLCDGVSVHLDSVLRTVEKMVADGADWVDVGGESTRPGAKPVPVVEELDRVIPVLEAIRQRFDVPVSIDTSTAQVIRAAQAAGASMINDVRALRREGALQAAAEGNLPICLMHMQGEPDTMQQSPSYRDVVADVTAFLQERVAACEEVGIARERIILDPGFGFGKTLEHNLTLFRALPKLREEGFSLLVGVSRKNMIGTLLQRDVGERMIGSVAMALLAAQKGAAFVRVHDVRETVDALNVLAAIEQHNLEGK
ncbi:dihydropteroate synthase [Porticoccaceae bacterium LTM1]|nr:dihydropteroate synthase [Porticoccaceae bacterium LTM1]